MIGSNWRGVFRATISIGLVGLFCAGGLIARGGEPAPNGRINDFLSSGEFGPARAAAQQLAPQERDQWLVKISAAQWQAGARHGSLSTAYEIGGDLPRQQAFNQYQGPPVQKGAAGGGVQADFDSLIDLITTTVSPQSWDEVGGPGSIERFATGVYVDAKGLLKKLPADADMSLAEVRRTSARVSTSRDPLRPSALRRVSLTRLEREVQLLHAQGKSPDAAMQALAGITRIQYLFVYPETGDIVIAGPAGDWKRDWEGRLVDVEKGRPVLSLDDLVVTLRNAYGKEGVFGCSITPTQEGLAKARAVQQKWSAVGSLSPGQTQRWLEEVRAGVGKQDITVHGIDPRTRAARVIVEADYRMKLVGMGLEKSVAGVTSYLNSIDLKPGEAPPPMDVLRWWFVLNYDALSATEPRDAFELRGPGAKVLSENEMITERGERVHSGKSDALNSQFARGFSKQFELLAAKYPVYADLRNIFDLALVSAILKSGDLPGQVGWHLTHFGPQGDYQVPLGPTPAQVDSVVNHRLINGKHVVAGVSGGVEVDARSLVQPSAIKTDTYGLLKAARGPAAPRDLPRNAWWWD